MNNNLMVELPSASECNGALTFARMNVARSARAQKPLSAATKRKLVQNAHKKGNK